MHPALALALFSCLLVRSAAAVNLQTPSKCSGDDGVMQSKTLTPTVAATDSSGNHHPTPAPKRVKRRGKCTKRDVFASLDRDRLASACSSIGVTPVTITETASARPHTWSIDAHCPVTVTETLTETDTRLSSHYITDAATAIVTVTAIETVTSTQLETETQPWTYTEVHTELHTEVYTVESVTSIQWTNIDTTTATATMTETAILTETATLTVTTTAAPAPICKNGNFESGNTDGWTVYSRTGTGDAQVVESFGYGSSHSLKMSTSGASGEDNKVVYGQEINCVSGGVYRFSFDAKVITSSSVGNSWTVYLDGGRVANGNGANFEWKAFSVIYNCGPAASKKLQIVTESLAGKTGSFYFDNIYLLRLDAPF